MTRKKPIDFSQDQVEAMLRAATLDFADGKHDRAERILTAVVRLAPGDPRPYKLLGSVLFHLKKYQPAEATYTKALGFEPNDPFVLVALAELKFVLLKYVQALELLSQLRKVDPEAKHPASARARWLLGQQRAKLEAAGT